jgi:hypothetical protein
MQKFIASVWPAFKVDELPDTKAVGGVPPVVVPETLKLLKDRPE